MKAFTANKDALSVLSGVQKSIITSCNERNGAAWALPRQPLWAFCGDGVFPKDRKWASCTVGKPQCNPADGTLLFPVRLISEDGGEETLSIRFATVRGIPEDSLLQTQKLPLRLSSFRTGTVKVEDNAWELSGEQWHKCASV